MNDSIWCTEVPSPLGDLALAASGRGLCGVYFRGQRWFPSDSHTWIRQDRRFDPVIAWLADYFAGQSPTFRGVLDLRGTEFQQSVWQALQKIPHGSTTSYRDVALAIGRPTATRAVGAAIGRNPISLIIPCHRVVGRQGDLTGYAGGLERKEYLLRLEGRGR